MIKKTQGTNNTHCLDAHPLYAHVTGSNLMDISAAQVTPETNNTSRDMQEG